MTAEQSDRPDAWIILLTDPRVSYGHYRVAALGRDGRLADKLSRARVFATQEAAEEAIREHKGGWVATVAPLHVNAVPALPWVK